eukprot:snap_masked-scaffold_42-processed-gene-1.36-mRNA-1 protein AED:0.13 eAED:1.00 QI:0/0/0/1/1/1/2/0/340
MCLSLTTANTCGQFGVCDEVLNTCVCDKGWSQSVELVYFPFTKDGVEFNETAIFDRLPCSLNKTMLFIFFLLTFVSCTLALLYNLPHLTTRKRIQRQFLLILSFLFYAISSLIRVIDIDRIYGEDKAFTVTLALAIFFQNTGTCVFVSKYISYHLIKRNKAFGSELKILGANVTPILNSAIPAFITLDIILLPIFALPAFVGKQKAGYLFYAESALQGVRCVTFSLLTYSTSMGVIKDMQIIIDAPLGEDQQPQPFRLYCEGAVPNLKMVTSSVYQELIHKYYFAVNGFAWAGMSTVITYALVKNLKIAKNLKSTPLTQKKNTISTRNPTSVSLPATISI